MALTDDYRHSKEAFVSDTTGSTVSHVNMISLVALASIALHSAIRSRFPPRVSFLFLSEWLLLVVPILLSMTLFADHPGTLSAALLLPTGFVCFVFPPHQSGTPLPSSGTFPTRTPPTSRPTSDSSLNDKRQRTSSSRAPETTTRLPALSTYRAHMMLVTVLAILAVDFPVFPRALAKCETYGVSFMDMGVGSFVFSQGIISATPIIEWIKYPARLRPPLMLEIKSALKKTLPVLALGLIRVVLVKSTEYPEHVTEYGVHWNFFLTLALIPVLRVVLHPFIASMPVSLLGLLVALAHQIFLSAGLMAYVLNSPRETLISANKEGLVSLTGYLAIHLLGLSTGTLIIPHSPSYFRRQQVAAKKRRNNNGGERTDSSTDAIQHKVQAPAYRENDKTATELFSYAVIYWVLFGISKYLHIGGPDVSRRVVNLPYIAWVAAYNTTVLLCYFLMDLAFFPTPLSKSMYSPVSGLKVVRHPNDNDSDSDSTSTTTSTSTSTSTSGPFHHGDTSGLSPGVTMTARPSPMPAPPLLEAINQNSLAIFLLANVATGVVNLLMQTMYASDTRAMCVLVAYAFGVGVFAWAMRGRRVWKL